MHQCFFGSFVCVLFAMRSAAHTGQYTWSVEEHIPERRVYVPISLANKNRKKKNCACSMNVIFISSFESNENKHWICLVFLSFCQKPNAKWNEIPDKHIHTAIERIQKEKKSNWNYRVDSFLHVSCGSIWCFSVRLIFQCFNFYVFCLHQHRVALRQH